MLSYSVFCVLRARRRDLGVTLVPYEPATEQ
jgi:hypothetical protein